MCYATLIEDPLETSIESDMQDYDVPFGVSNQPRRLTMRENEKVKALPMGAMLLVETRKLGLDVQWIANIVCSTSVSGFLDRAR